MQKLFFTILVILFSFLSCNKFDDEKDILQIEHNVKKDKEVIAVIDTMKYMNSLFRIKKLKLSKPSSIIIDRIVDYNADKNENIYLLDASSKLYKFNNKGKLIKILDNRGRGPGEILNVMRFTIDKKENVYLDDYLQGEIKIYDKNFKFKKSIRKKYFPAIVDMTIRNDTLFCFDPFLNKHSIIMYNIRNGFFIGEIGRIDNLVKKFRTRIKSGNIILNGKYIYYILPNYYKIYRLNLQSNSEISLITERPFHFRQINKKIVNPMKTLGDYSTVLSLIKETDFYFIITSPPKGIINKKYDEYFPTDVIKYDGKILKEAIMFKNISNPIKKYENKKYISFNENELNIFNITIFLLKYKY